MTFEQAVEYMNSFTNLEKQTGKYSDEDYRLDRMSSLMEVFNNPQNNYKIIHIAGSKGKGSTAAFIAKAIEAAGYKTGLYLSPHVHSYKERFTLAGKFIDDSFLTKTADILKQGIDTFTVNNPKPTVFELYTAFAFILFSELKCDFVSLEVGLGGRLDATNIVKPLACVLTPIELEHTQILGNTVSQIAVEKSKIIKERAKVFCGFQKEQALEVIKQEAVDNNCEFYYLKDKLKVFETEYRDSKQFVTLEYADGFSTKLELNMTGLAQAYNCALALPVLRSLNLYKKGITEKALEQTVLPGRLEKKDFCKRKFYLDGAHTVQSITLLLESWAQMHPLKKGLCIFGCIEGKNDCEMQKLIYSVFDKIIVSKPGTFKKSNPSLLYQNFKKIQLESVDENKHSIFLSEDSQKATEKAVEISDEDEDILVCGSFYLAGEISQAMDRLAGKK